MELEENMLIRTKDGIIDKVIIEYNGICNSPNCNLKHISCEKNYYDEEEIKKFSYDIIDLIEVGDLLMIEYFSPRYNKRVTRLFEVTFKYDEYIHLDNAKCTFMLINNDWSNNDKDLKPIIKQILTHEQFESISYKVN